MIDPQLLREHPEVIRASQAARGDSVELVDEALAADTERRAAITAFETLRAQQNAFGKTVAAAPKDEKPALIAQVQQLAGEVKAAQLAASDREEDFRVVAGRIGNVIVDGVPSGGEDDYVVLKHISITI